MSSVELKINDEWKRVICTKIKIGYEAIVDKDPDTPKSSVSSVNWNNFRNRSFTFQNTYLTINDDEVFTIDDLNQIYVSGERVLARITLGSGDNTYDLSYLTDGEELEIPLVFEAADLTFDASKSKDSKVFKKNLTFTEDRLDG